MSKQAQMLKKIQRDRRITQAELARLLHVSPSHICKIVSGERELGKHKMREASRILGVPMETFFQ